MGLGLHDGATAVSIVATIATGALLCALALWSEALVSGPLSWVFGAKGSPRRAFIGLLCVSAVIINFEDAALLGFLSGVFFVSFMLAERKDAAGQEGL